MFKIIKLKKNIFYIKWMDMHGTNNHFRSVFIIIY